VPHYFANVHVFIINLVMFMLTDNRVQCWAL
jgi:hypothetical protein